jgi:hypothetical protein
MKAIHHRSLALAVTAIVAVARIGTAQERSPGLLNHFEVQQLVTRGEPADHARLSSHFAALADRYEVEAKNHIAMAQSFVGHPNRSVSTGMSAHCQRLADLNTQSATTVRELATYHAKQAAGVPATPPRDGSRLEGGAGARVPEGKELKALASKARTRAEHKALEEYFLTLARRYTAAADEHVTLAQAHRGTRIAQAAMIHDRLAALARDTAKEATAAADMHQQLADVAR